MYCVGVLSPSKLGGEGDGVSAGHSVDTAIAFDCSNWTLVFFIPFCVVRWTLCDATLERVTVYHMEIMGNEILLYEFSLCELFSVDRIKLINRAPPNGSTVLVDLGVLVEVSGSHSDTLPTLRLPWTSDRPFAEGYLYWNCTRTRTHAHTHTACFIMLIIKWIDT
jgi:hypothetical protein